MPADFSTPIYAEETSSPEESSSLSDVSEVEGIDLNDPSLLQEEIVGANPDADPYAAPPPPPDGWYRVKLKRLDVKQKGKDGTVVLQAYSTKPEIVKGVPVLLPNG